MKSKVKPPNRLPVWIITVSLLLITGLACSIPGLGASQETDKPVAALSSPISGEKVPINQETKVQSVSIDDQGVVRVELIVNEQIIWTDANADPQPEAPFIVAQPWTPTSPGTYVIQVRAYNANDAAGESEPLTVEVVADPEVAAAEVAVASTTTPGATAASGASSGDILIASPTVSPTRTPITAAATAESSPSPTVTITNTPTATPKPQTFSPTGQKPEGRFKDIWVELGSGNSRLGYPIGPEIKDRNYAKQFFENGFMLWWDNPAGSKDIWVLDSPVGNFLGGATSNYYLDTWDSDSGDYSCDTARNGGPVRGFGKVWCEHPELQPRLGYPSEPEAGSGGNAPYAHVQFFQGGFMFYNPANKAVYVVFDQGDWQRFNY